MITKSTTDAPRSPSTVVSFVSSFVIVVTPFLFAFRVITIILKKRCTPSSNLQIFKSTVFQPKALIDNHQHLAQPMRVHSLLPDYELEDVWHLPVTLSSTQSLQLFMDQFAKTNAELVKKGAAGILFRFRLFLGRLFKWDKKVLQDKLIPGTIRYRYAQQERLTYQDLPDPGSGSFIPVYKLENEYLSEIENSTVYGALHLSRVPSGPDTWTVHMAVYVKPKGLFGRFYMALITPFRLWIVYPSLMKAAGRNWGEYVADNLEKRGH